VALTAISNAPADGLLGELPQSKFGPARKRGQRGSEREAAIHNGWTTAGSYGVKFKQDVRRILRILRL